MKVKPYRLVVVMLIACVAAVLALQGFWLWSFYGQKKEEFSRTVYQALDVVSQKLAEREGIRQVQEEVIVSSGDGDKATESRVTIRRRVENGSSAHSQSMSRSFSGTGSLDSVSKIISHISSSSSSSSGSFHRPRLHGVFAVNADKEREASEETMKALLNKVLMEIKVIDTDEKNADTIRNIINRAFKAKGLFVPVEFALIRQRPGNKQVLAASNGFDSLRPSFVRDLSLERVVSSGKLLMVQLNGATGFILSAMKPVFILSVFFTMLIAGIFYYTLRVILNQKKLNDIKNDFINNMTHELKTPIATITLASRALNTNEIVYNEAKRREYLRIVTEENEKLGKHVEQVLQTALLDRGELQMNCRPMQIKPLLEETVAAFGLRAESQGASVNLHGSTDAQVMADANHLRSVFNNLLDNALKYAGSKCKVDIYLTVSQHTVELCFKDNGPGIEPGKQEKVFEKFYRVQEGNLHEVKGFGLGLSYVKSIVEAHNGTILLRSKPGWGSEFILKFRTHA